MLLLLVYEIETETVSCMCEE